MKILTTLARPDAGQARRRRATTSLADPDAVRRAIGVVAQRSSVDREATGRENLRLQGQVYGMRGRELEARLDELLERFGLADAADRIARALLGGMERRLDIAMALVHRPQVLFLDEPTTGLDPEVRADMWEEISRLANEQGLTILLTTHYLEEADHLASQLAIVDRGRVVAAGTPEELKSDLRGDAIHVELATPTATTARCASRSSALEAVREVIVDGRTAARPRRRRRPRGARRAPGARGAAGSTWRRSRSHGRRSTTSTCATPGRTFDRPRPRREREVKR